MGFYASFDIPDTDVTVLEAIHYSFFRPFLLEEPEPVDDRYTDFWVTVSLLDEVEQALMVRFDKREISPTSLITTAIDDLRRTDEETTDDETLLHLHLNALRRLRQAVTVHGPLICSWSA